MMNKKVKWVCATCGSDNISSDAMALWDVAKQEWVLNGLIGDDYFCGECDGECNAEEQKLTEHPEILVLVNEANGRLHSVGLFGEDDFDERTLEEHLEMARSVYMWKALGHTNMAALAELCRSQSATHPSFFLAALVSGREIQEVNISDYIG